MIGLRRSSLGVRILNWVVGPYPVMVHMSVREALELLTELPCGDVSGTQGRYCAYLNSLRRACNSLQPACRSQRPHRGEKE
jgi:hypothetical protein